MNSLEQQSLALIERGLREFSRPALFWSGGKDSMVLLHLIFTKLEVRVPVVCFREPWFPHKQKFANEIIQQYQLEIWDWAPSKVALCQGNGRIDVLNYYQMSASCVANSRPAILARGTEPPEEGKPWLCGVDTFLSRPTGSFDAPWNCYFHGHKSSDEDPCSGKVALRTDILLDPPNPATVFPLRHWTDKDVFDYIGHERIPYDKNRYDISYRKVFSEKRENPDYYHACFKCCDPTSSQFVECPKLKATVNNISHLVPWEKPRAEYCSLRDS